MITERLLRVALVGSAWVLYLLLALSVLSFATMIERALFFRKHAEDVALLRERLTPLLLAGDWDGVLRALGESRSIEARVLRRALVWRKGGAPAVSDALDAAIGEEKRELERGTNLLGTLGNNAPFVGLFGTVLGVIEAFHQLSAGPGGSAMGNVMSGIAEALVATGVGLFVALPAVVAYNLLQKKIGEIEGNAATLGKLVTSALHASNAASEPASRPAEASGPAEPASEPAEASEQLLSLEPRAEAAVFVAEGE